MRPLRPNLTMALAVALLTAGVVLLARPWWTGIMESRGQAELAASLQARQVGAAFAAAAGAPAGPDGPAMPPLIPLGHWWPPGPIPRVYARLSIPAIGLRTFVIRGMTLTDYYDQLAWGPSHLRGSAEPGGIGNAVIFGHVDEFGSPFRLLDRLRVGDAVDLNQGQRTVRYTVQAVWSVVPSDIAVTGPLGPGVRALTLITCTGLANTRRLVVRAITEAPPAEGAGEAPASAAPAPAVRASATPAPAAPRGGATVAGGASAGGEAVATHPAGAVAVDTTRTATRPSAAPTHTVPVAATMAAAPGRSAPVAAHGGSPRAPSNPAVAGSSTGGKTASGPQVTATAGKAPAGATQSGTARETGTPPAGSPTTAAPAPAAPPAATLVKAPPETRAEA